MTNLFLLAQTDGGWLTENVMFGLILLMLGVSLALAGAVTLKARDSSGGAIGLASWTWLVAGIISGTAGILEMQMSFVTAMFDRTIAFDKPWYLLLLSVIPIMWVFSFKSLAGLGPFRRLFAISFRTVVVALIILALAEAQSLKTSDKITVYYLLDQSESIPLTQRQAMLQYVVKEVATHRDADREDKAGVIVFGHDAAIEIPPFDDDIPFIGLENTLRMRTDSTNLEAALKMAQASFPEDAAKRLVVVTDGNENIGDARSIARMLVDDGIGIDVVPIELDVRGEVRVEKVTLPSDIRIGQPIEARVVLNNDTPTSAPNGGRVKGKLKLYRRVGQQEELLNPNNQDVELKPGKQVFSFQHKIEDAAVFTYEARFTPDDPAADLQQQNNQATAYTHVRDKGQILFIEDIANKKGDGVGEFSYLVERLRANNLKVKVRFSNDLFTSLAELQGYDCVVLGNVPQASGEDANAISSFDDDQIKMLVQNTEQFGCGLVMLGGPASYGVGGWANTELEKAMPVDFQIRNDKIRAVGALVMIMHASEMAQGNHWQKKIAREAIRVLGPMDYCGLVHWGPGRDEWLWKAGGKGLVRVQQVGRNKMMARVDRMTPGDMPQFDPAMKMSLAAYNQCNAAVKQMIIISDGDPSPPSFLTIQGYKQAKVKISTVAVGTHGPAGHATLRNIAQATGGRYYVVKNPKALPRIFVREARRVAKPLIREDGNGIGVKIDYPHEILQGIDSVPPVTGYVMTSLKESPLVEVGLVAPGVPRRNGTVMAAWSYGMGRTVAFTSDAGERWANQWTQWENYDKFFTQMIRWAMRPVNEDGKFSVSSMVKDGKVRVVINALDQNDEFLNHLEMEATAVRPDLQDKDFKIRQQAPGRYVGEFDVDKSGSYFLAISPGGGKSPILAGVNVPYSSEYRDRESNQALLTSLAKLTPKGGKEGKLIKGDMDREKLDTLLETNTFRHDLAKAISSQDIWPLLVLISAGLFFGDVLIRRVQVHFYWVFPMMGQLIGKVLGRKSEEEPGDQRLERLKSRKAAISEEVDQRRSAARFEPVMDEAAPARDLDEVIGEATGGSPSDPQQRPTQPETSLAAEEEDSYTSRLLKAKQQVRKQ